VKSCAEAGKRKGSDIPDYLRIATEEAFATEELLAGYRSLVEGHRYDDPGFLSLWGFYAGNPGERARFVLDRLPDLGEKRLADMDRSGISRQLLLLTSPGVQVFDRDTAVGIASSSNDELAAAVRKHPDRFSGLAAVAPQDPVEAARELDRAVRALGLKGAVVNSHTHGEYLDDPKFYPIFEAAESLGVPVYIHPQTPSRQMIQPFLDRGLDGAIFGFAVETGLHLLRIIVAGVFDRFPRLQIVVGHLGEGLPFWLYRLDYMHQATVRARRYETMKPIGRKPSEYLRENVFVTSSGMPWAPAITHCQEVLGADRVLYAMDYPYQYEADEVAMSDAIPAGEAEKKQFFQTNAEKVFNL
jgi:2,3-dihydroxybenzoate decarboxylase